MKPRQIVPISSLSDDLLCALVARNEIRKTGSTITASTTKFLEVFHEYADIKKGKNQKQSSELEKQRKTKLLDYVRLNLSVTDSEENPTDKVILD